MPSHAISALHGMETMVSGTMMHSTAFQVRKVSQHKRDDGAEDRAQHLDLGLLDGLVGGRGDAGVAAGQAEVDAWRLLGGDELLHLADHVLERRALVVVQVDHQVDHLAAVVVQALQRVEGVREPVRSAASERCSAAQRGLASLFPLAATLARVAAVTTDCTPSMPRTKKSKRSTAFITGQRRQASPSPSVSA